MTPRTRAIEARIRAEAADIIREARDKPWLYGSPRTRLNTIVAARIRIRESLEREAAEQHETDRAALAVAARVPVAAE